MKKIIISAVSLILLFRAESQSTQLPGVARSVPDTLIQKKLVELATSGPSSELAEHQNKILQYQLKAAKNSWLNLLTLSFNYNDLTFKNQSSTNVYPKYFLGVNVPLGTLFSRTQVKTRKEQIQVSENEQEILRRSLKSEILKMYLQYRNYNELILLQTNLSDDEETSYLKAKESFKKGVLSIEAYTVAQKKYTDEIIKSKQLELDRNILKLQIESVINMSIEDVILLVAADQLKNAN